MDDLLDFKQTCSSFALADINLIKINISSLIKNNTVRNVSNQEQYTNNLSAPFNQADLMKLMYFCKNLSPINQMRHNFIKYLWPILIVFGLFGNLISIIVMLKKYTSKTKYNKQFSFCLANLCFADLAIIFFGCIREYIDEVYNVSIRSKSIHSCRFFFFVCYLFSAYSSYLYSFLGYSQWQSITNIKKFEKNQMQQTKRNKITISIIFLSCVLICLPFLYYPLINESIKADFSQPLDVKIDEKCEIDQNGDILLTLLDSIIFCFVPFLLCILFSILTASQIIKRSQFRKKFFNNSYARSRSLSTKKTKLDSLKNVTHENFELQNIELKPREEKVENIKIDSTPVPNSIKKLGTHFCNEIDVTNEKTHSNYEFSILLIAFPVTYVVANSLIFSIILFRLIEYYFELGKKVDYEMGFLVSKMFMYLNNSLNILLFIIFDKNFRKEILYIMKKITNYKIKTSTLGTF